MENDLPRPLLIAVTVLTSLDHEALRETGLDAEREARDAAIYLVGRPITGASEPLTALAAINRSLPIKA